MSVPMSMPILVVDDYSTMVRIVRNLLRQLGFQNIDAAHDSEGALKKMRQRPYGLLISDWTMRDAEGRALIGEVRADDALKDTPVLMLTTAEGNDPAHAGGADGYLPGPFNAAALKKRLSAVFGEEF